MLKGSFPGSCAISVLYSFSSSHHDARQKEEAEATLRYNDPKNNGHQAINLVVLNQVQIGGVLERELLANGYKCVADKAFHPNHQSYVSLYARVNFPEKSKPREEIISGEKINTEEINRLRGEIDMLKTEREEIRRSITSLKGVLTRTKAVANTTTGQEKIIPLPTSSTHRSVAGEPGIKKPLVKKSRNFWDY